MKAIVFVIASHVVLLPGVLLQESASPLAGPFSKYYPNYVNSYFNTIPYGYGFQIPYGYGSVKWPKIYENEIYSTPIRNSQSDGQNLFQGYNIPGSNFDRGYNKRPYNVIVKNDPLANNFGHKMYGENPNRIQRILLLQNQGGTQGMTTSAYLLARLQQRLEDPSKKIISVPGDSRNEISKYQSYWNVLVDEFIKKYINQNPRVVDVFQGTDSLARVKNFEIALSVFLKFLKARWGSMLATNDNIRKIFDDLVQYKKMLQRLSNSMEPLQKGPGNQQGFLTQVLPMEKPYDSVVNTKKNNAVKDSDNTKKETKFVIQTNFPGYNVYEPGNINDGFTENKVLNDGWMVPNKYSGNKPWKDVKMTVGKHLISQWLLDNKNRFNYPPSPSTVREGTPIETLYQTAGNNDHDFVKRDCNLSDISKSLAILVNKPNINEEKDNLKLLFNIIKMYILKHGTNNLPFGQAVLEIGKILLRSNNKPLSTQTDDELGWQLFLNEYRYGELHKLFLDINSGKQIDALIVVNRLKDILIKLKQILIRRGFSDKTVYSVLDGALATSLRFLTPYFEEQCKKTTYKFVLSVLELALNTKVRENAINQ